MLLIFGLWVNYLPLPDEKIDIGNKYQLERTVPGRQVLGIYGGDGFAAPPGGSGGLPTNQQGLTDRGPDRFEDYDPSPKIPNTGGSGSKGKKLESNQIPDETEWKTDPAYWNQKLADSCNEDEEPSDSIKVDFRYELDFNKNPTLLIETIGLPRQKRPFTKVEFDQTASHIHHAPELGIELPASFDMSMYQRIRGKADRIEYAKANLPREVIIAYQNEIGKSLRPIFGMKTRPIPGTAGKLKNSVELTIQQNPNNPNENRLSVVNDRGIHVSSYSKNRAKLLKITKNEFWIWEERNYN